MADKKISQLADLTVPVAGDYFVVVDTDASETKKVTLGNICLNLTSSVFKDNVTITDTKNITFASGEGSTGTKIGTGTTEKFAFWNATPIVQPSAIVDLSDVTSFDEGSATETEVQGIVDKINSILAMLRTVGLIAN